MNERMMAVTNDTYGGPEAMKFEEVARPVPKDDEVLVKVVATSVNPYDWHILRGSPWFIRMAENSYARPKQLVLGADISGTIEAVGKHVVKFKVGDEVFGDINHGAFAQYAKARVDLLTHKPKDVSHMDAGVVGIAGLTALQSVRDWGQVKQGQQVLIIGASGGVGTYAVQIAKSLGAAVTGVCSTANIEMVKALGADHVIDYTKQDFAELDQKYDVVIDIAANRTSADIKKAMKPKSIWVLVGMNLKNMAKIGLFGRWLFSESGKAAIVKIAEVLPADLKTLGEMLSAGTIKSQVDRTYTLQDTPTAIEYIETMRAKGKVGITVE